MTVDRVDLNNRTITADRQLDRFGNLEPPKSELGNRTFAINDTLVVDPTALIECRGTPKAPVTCSGQPGWTAASQQLAPLHMEACGRAAGQPELTSATCGHWPARR